jgi:hypothetical protein
LITTAILLLLAVMRINVPDPIVTLGFGRIHPSALLELGTRGNGSAGLLGSAVLANLPQVAASLLYLLFNSVYTCMLLAHEYSGYAVHRKPLRVTAPKGQQRSTYWLQLPLTFAVPLMIASTLLHWLISQSIFLVSISVWKDEREVEDDSVATVGYSCAPMLGVIVVGVCMLYSLYVVWDRELQYHVPIAVSCSFAISAHAHRPEADVGASLLEVNWGVVEESSTPDGIGHCAFTSQGVTEMLEGNMYAGRAEDQ